MTGAPAASGDEAFWQALGVPPELRDGIAAQTVVPIWPDNLPALDLFVALQTQWRTGFNGPTGLDYAAVAATLDLQGVAPADRCKLFADLRVMEAEALKVFKDGRRQ